MSRCAFFDPNPSPHNRFATFEKQILALFFILSLSNLIVEYHLIEKQKELAGILRQQGVLSLELEQRLWQVQEYRSHCPVQANFSQDQKQLALLDISCDKFKVYIYPQLNGEDIRPVYAAILDTIRRSPYFTEDPAEACIFIPAFDVSCWCESCVCGAFDNIIDVMQPESATISERLKALPYWSDGRNHMLFEIEDGPCMPFEIGYAIAAKSGLSEFHLRAGLDVSIPLFGMVEFSAIERHVPPTERPYLLTFRGTRSERSDSTRNELYRIHNDADIILLVACRWYGETQHARGSGYDENCAEQEQSFYSHTYSELATGSKFSLILEGFGYDSIRLTEMMSAGSIPVIVCDHYVLPFADILDWENFSIRVPEHHLEQV